MTRDREGDLERICQEALELPVAERADFLVEACGGDEGLRREAEALLAHDGAAASFLATPAMAMAARELDAGPALAVGQQFGPYTIVSRLGAGGMGEVYRARDPTLRRDVAIKVLPTLFTRDPDRLARFEREAQLLASLNHPNIATIHGLEQWTGSTRWCSKSSRARRSRSDCNRRLRFPGTEAAATATTAQPSGSAAGRGPDDRATDCRGARSGARAGRHPPRPEAGQHQDSRPTAS